MPLLSQSRLYGAVLRATGRDVVDIPLGPGGGCGVARTLVRRFAPLGHVALIPGGPLWCPGAAPDARRAALAALPGQARDLGIRALISNCADPADAAHLQAMGHLPLITGQTLARLDLTAPAAQRRARLHGKWRNRLARAEAANLASCHAPFDPAHDGWLLLAETAQRRARRYRGLPPAFAAHAARIAPDQTRLFTASGVDGALLGAMLFLLHGASASYFIGHATGPGRHASVHNLLLWQAADWLAARGIARLDLGPIDTQAGAGLARFKLGSGATPVTLGPTCLHTRLTAPAGRLAARVSRSVSRAAARRTDRSCR